MHNIIERISVNKPAACGDNDDTRTGIGGERASSDAADGGRMDIAAYDEQAILAAAADIARLAAEIWREHYAPIIGLEQVEYMLEKFQSAERVFSDIMTGGYIYFTAKSTADAGADSAGDTANDGAGDAVDARDVWNAADTKAVEGAIGVGDPEDHDGAGGGSVGYAAVTPIDGSRLLLSKIYVRRDCRGRGIARRFLEEAVKVCRDEFGLGVIRLTVNKHNEGSISAYQKMGFETVDSVVTDIGGGYYMDDYIMELQLI